jgi:hypothetical protein
VFRTVTIWNGDFIAKKTKRIKTDRTRLNAGGGELLLFDRTLATFSAKMVE